MCVSPIHTTTNDAGFVISRELIAASYLSPFQREETLISYAAHTRAPTVAVCELFLMRALILFGSILSSAFCLLYVVSSPYLHIITLLMHLREFSFMLL